MKAREDFVVYLDNDFNTVVYTTGCNIPKQTVKQINITKGEDIHTVLSKAKVPEEKQDDMVKRWIMYSRQLLDINQVHHPRAALSDEEKKRYGFLTEEDFKKAPVTKLRKYSLDKLNTIWNKQGRKEIKNIAKKEFKIPIPKGIHTKILITSILRAQDKPTK